MKKISQIVYSMLPQSIWLINQWTYMHISLLWVVSFATFNNITCAIFATFYYIAFYGATQNKPSLLSQIPGFFLICLSFTTGHYTYAYTHTHTHTCLTALFPGLSGWASTRKIKPIWISLKQETVSSSGISWAIRKSAPSSRQITMPAPHHSVFYRPDALPFIIFPFSSCDCIIFYGKAHCQVFIQDGWWPLL